MTTETLKIMTIGLLLIIVCVIAICKMWDSPKNQEFRQRREEEAKRVQEKRYREGKVIVEVKLLDGGSVDFKRGGLGGAMVGGLVAGPLGAMVGATAHKGRGTQLQKFAVKYSDGHVVIKECHPNSWEYKDLMKYVKWEDM